MAVGLFLAHTLIIFETAHFITGLASELTATLGRHVAGPLLIATAFLVLFVTHLAEAGVWALFFLRTGQFKTFSESMYFAGTSLTTLGYGDVVLNPPWRSVGPILGTNGILMFGCSTAFLFLVIQAIWKAF